MARPEGVACEVVYSHDYEAQAKAIEPDYARLDEMMAGAEWVIARSPLRGDVIVILNPGGDLPRLAVSATIGDDQAEVTGIETAE